MLYSRMLFGRPRQSCRLTRPFPAPSALAPSSSLRISGNSRSSANDHPTRSAFRSRLPAKVYLFAANVYPLPRKGYLLAVKVYLQDELSPHNKVALFAGNKVELSPARFRRRLIPSDPPRLKSRGNFGTVARWQRRGVGHTEFVIQS